MKQKKIIMALKEKQIKKKTEVKMETWGMKSNKAKIVKCTLV